MTRAVQGSGSAEWMVVGVLAAVHFCSILASSATFTVGDAQGWTIGPNYATWVAGKTFAKGDVLFFAYAQGAHNVVEVNKSDYDACSATNPIATYTNGNTSVPLNSTGGTSYFLCSFPGHCSAGMHLAITVGASATPTPAPSTSVGTPPPTPATTTTPAPAPANASSSSPPTPTPPAPVPSPGNAGTPVPTPAPTSGSSPTPAPTPSPTSPSSVNAGPSPTSPPTPPSTSPPPSLQAPSSTTSAPPPSAAPSLPSSTSLAAVLLGLGGALLAL